MAHDAFQRLRAMADHAEAFGAGAAQAEAAVMAIFAAAVKVADNEGLGLICDGLGAEEFDALADRLKPADVKAVVDRIHGPAKPARSPKVAVARLKRTARRVPVAPEFDLAALDLAGLRDVRKALGNDFVAWLTKEGVKAKPALQAIDPGFPKVDKISPTKARPRLIELAGGSKPTPAFRLADLDVDGMRRAWAELGDDFDAWLRAQKGPDLKAALVRIDPLRPKVGKLPKADYPFLLREIAAGGALVTADDDVTPIGDVKFSMRDG